MYKKLLLITLTSFLLSSCGGGNGGGDNNTKSMEFMKEVFLPEHLNQPTITDLNNGNILLSGGCTEYQQNGHCKTQSNRSFLFKKSTQEITEVGEMNEARNNGKSVLLNNGNVLVYGNAIAGGYHSNTYEVFNTSTNTFQSYGIMSQARDGAEAVSIGNKAYIIAGYGGLYGSQGIEIYDENTDFMSLSNATFENPVENVYAAKLPNNKILITGGYNSAGSGTSYKDTYIYSPETDDLEKVEDFIEPISNTNRYLPSKSFDVGNDNICIAFTSINKAYLYNYVSNKWGGTCLVSGYIPDGYIDGKYINIGGIAEDTESYIPETGDGPGIHHVISISSDKVTGIHVKFDSQYNNNCDCYKRDATSLVTYKLLAPR